MPIPGVGTPGYHGSVATRPIGLLELGNLGYSFCPKFDTVCHSLFAAMASLATRLAMAMMVRIGGFPSEFGKRLASAT